ncbi:MAG: hypothetical protein ABIF10_01035 [Candidatus Woesearchaeota archaeon]
MVSGLHGWQGHGFSAFKEKIQGFVFFRKIGDSTRAVLVKRQNAEFVEVHLADHKE